MNTNFLLLVLMLTSDQGQALKQSLMVVDNQYIHKLVLDGSENPLSYKRKLPFWDAAFLTVKSFQSGFIAILSYVQLGYKVDYLRQTNFPYSSSIYTVYPITHAVSSLDRTIYYALESSGQIIRFNVSDYSRTVIQQIPIQCPSQANLQMDYSKGILYYLDCTQEDFYLLLYMNPNDYTDDGGTPLSKMITKFEIDFHTNEIFGFVNQTLYKGKLGDPNMIHFNEFYTSPEDIVDLAVTPSHVYLIIRGNNTLQVVERTRISSAITNLIFDNPQAIAYLDAAPGTPSGVSTSSVPVTVEHSTGVTISNAITNFSISKKHLLSVALVVIFNMLGF